MNFALSYASYFGEALAEKGLLPDPLLRRGIRYRCAQILSEYEGKTVDQLMQDKVDYIKSLKERPIAINTRDANTQHYEVPTEFFKLVMGKYMKYSSCYYTPATKSLDEAEEKMLSMYVDRAQISDGMSIMDLGCGWGSFSLYVSARFPNVKVTSVSNSATQREYIENEAKRRGFHNLRVITCDMNEFDIEDKFDRIISIEMFEHMKNYEKLLEKVSKWLKKEGMLFVHIFTHKSFAYDFKSGDWMADNFFSGGTMPSDDLLFFFQKDLHIVDHWVVDGTHYSKTSEDWLKNMDKKAHQQRIREIFEDTYGKENIDKWIVMWRLFFLACAELFGYANGQEWVVSHYLFKNKKQ